MTKPTIAPVVATLAVLAVLVAFVLAVRTWRKL
jgi:hypothetical protein